MSEWLVGEKEQSRQLLLHPAQMNLRATLLRVLLNRDVEVSADFLNRDGIAVVDIDLEAGTGKITALSALREPLAHKLAPRRPQTRVAPRCVATA